MVKKLFVWLMLLMTICGSALASAAVVDDAGLFTDEEKAGMERMIDHIRSVYQMDAAVLTTTDTPYDPTEEVQSLIQYAHDYYDNNGYGIGDDRAGMLYMIDMHNRVPVISTTGLMIDYITDHRLSDLFDASAPYLRRGNYGLAAVAVLTTLTEQLRQGREAGSFRYDKETGKRLTGLYNPLTASEILIALLAGLGTLLAVVGGVRKSYELRGTTYRYHTKNNLATDMRVDSSRLINRRVTRSLRPTSSGTYGGGGGGGFGGGMGSGVSGGHGGGAGGRF